MMLIALDDENVHGVHDGDDLCDDAKVCVDNVDGGHKEGSDGADHVGYDSDVLDSAHNEAARVI